jgi:hypothetical protein
LGTERRHAAAIDRDGGHACAHAAHTDLLDNLIAGIRKRHSGEPDRQLGRVHVREIRQSVHRCHVLQIVRVPLRRHGGGNALLLTGYFKRIEHQHGAAHVEIPGDRLARDHRHGAALSVQPGIGYHQFVRAGRRIEQISARVVDQRAHVERRDLDAGADQTVAGGLVGDDAGDDAGRAGRRCIRSRYIRCAGANRRKGNQRGLDQTLRQCTAETRAYRV